MATPKATTKEQLMKLLEEFPNEYPSFFLADESFTFHCYRNHSMVEIDAKLKMEDMDDECSTWNVSPDEWKEQVEMALIVYQYECM